MTTLKGPVHTFGKRKYIVVTLPYRQAREVFKPELYTATNGKGEQRQIVNSHANNLRDEIRDGNFTPRSVSVGTRPRHRRSISWDTESSLATIELKENDSLPLTDGGHEFEAIERLVKEGEEKALDLDITALLMLDGDTQRDFINLQLGKPVDRAHMLCMKVQQKMVKKAQRDSLALAVETGKLLNQNEQSPFYRQIRFDSRGAAGIPVSTLASIGASDIATSLVGLARIGLAEIGESDTQDAPFLANCVLASYKALQKDAPEVLKSGMVLTPPPDGTKGSATMLVGLGVLLAYRLRVLGRKLPGVEDLTKLVEAAKSVLNEQVNGSFSGPTKRVMLGEFAMQFLFDVPGDAHERLPVGLLGILSASSLGVKALPKASKKAATPAAPEVEAQTPVTTVREETATEAVESLMNDKSIPAAMKNILMDAADEAGILEEVMDEATTAAAEAATLPAVVTTEKLDGAPWDGDKAAPWEEEVQG